MPVLTTTARTALQSCARQQLPAVRAPFAALQQRRNISEVQTTSSFDSPYRGLGSSEKTTSVPSFEKYKNKGGEVTGKTYQYFLVGTLGALSALGAKKTVQGGSAGDSSVWAD